jgi:LacI family transcriptional regulator, galactose operon repressor
MVPETGFQTRFRDCWAYARNRFLTVAGDEPMSNGRVTVRRVAEMAGVSPATVSRVSRGSTAVSPELRDRVLRVIEENGYVPNHLGRALAEKRHGALGLVFPGLSGPYFSELIQGFESAALDSGDSVLVLASHSRADTDAKVLDLAGRVDGMAIHAGTVAPDTIAGAAERTRVVVMAGLAGPAHSSVSADNGSMRALTRHLLVDHGYRRLAFVGTPEGSPDVTTRWQAFRAAHRSARRTAPAHPIRVGLQQSDGAIAARELFDGGEAPEAVVCANDEIALGLLMGAFGRGLRVPDDVAITGFDDIEMAALVQPGLTTVHQPVRELATTTARLLIDPLAQPAGDIVLTTDLVLRSSCGCSAGGNA